ncbi:MAG: hypothetical protein RLO18_36050 [Gimesia chilikensis]
MMSSRMNNKEKEMSEITITMSHDDVENILSAAGQAILFAEREISECTPEFPTYREFMERCLEHHRYLYHQFVPVFQRSRAGLNETSTSQEGLGTPDDELVYVGSPLEELGTEDPE